MNPVQVTLNQYDVVEFSEYNGKLQITLGYRDKSGVWKPKFCKREFGKGNERDVPLRIELGEIRSAALVLTSVAEAIMSPSKKNEDDIPF
jgi:hypothetical protein